MWLQHPRYASARSRLIKRFRVKDRRFRRLPHVVFLCGGFDSPRRTILRAYLEKQHPGLQVFFAEPIWDAISKNTTMSALEMEQQFARLADVVVVVVESPGTFAELGAFSLVSELRKKLLLLLEKKYQSDPSFINTGPVKWADAESHFAPAIYAPFETILSAASEVDERLARLAHPDTAAMIHDLHTLPKHFLFFVCDLVSVIGPASADIVRFFVQEIMSEDAPVEVSTCLELATAMRILKSISADGISYYVRSPSYDDQRPFHSANFLNLRQERAAHLSVIQTIPSACDLLHATGKA